MKKFITIAILALVAICSFSVESRAQYAYPYAITPLDTASVERPLALTDIPAYNNAVAEKKTATNYLIGGTILSSIGIIALSCVDYTDYDSVSTACTVAGVLSAVGCIVDAIGLYKYYNATATINDIKFSISPTRLGIAF